MVTIILTFLFHKQCKKTPSSALADCLMELEACSVDFDVVGSVESDVLFVEYVETSEEYVGTSVEGDVR